MAAAAAELAGRIQAQRPGLNPTLGRLADLVLAQPDRVKAMTIGELAQAAGVSQATVSRFVRSMGAGSYQQFRIMLAEGRAAGTVPPGQEVYEGIALGDEAGTIIAKIAHRQVAAIEAARRLLDPEELAKAARLVAARDTILFVAIGSSLLAAENGVMRFVRIGKACIFERDPNLQLFAIAGLAGRATLVAISDSGRTRVVQSAVQEALAVGMPTVAITSAANSPLARAADVLLATPASRPTGGEGIHESMVAKMAQLMVIDALYALVAVQEPAIALPRLAATDRIIARSRSR
ncbi:MurR/RpiR family transcriptional regulator [Geminicoccus flavidas]|uniref:MurR/RpiR family transcriptional regulator n=1 Tax=Geminicoccus flavidas TaxID=2506407 RepID=UPI00135B6B2A|nr:MurR/RpiR family transcriptional regulator [Geminicoccus flavidas]